MNRRRWALAGLLLILSSCGRDLPIAPILICTEPQEVVLPDGTVVTIQTCWGPR